MISEEKRERLRIKNSKRQRRISDARRKVIDGFISEIGRCEACGGTDDMHLRVPPTLYRYDRSRRNLRTLGRQLAVAEVLCTECFAKRNEER